jgi:hypothetical protein
VIHSVCETCCVNQSLCRAVQCSTCSQEDETCCVNRQQSRFDDWYRLSTGLHLLQCRSTTIDSCPTDDKKTRATSATSTIHPRTPFLAPGFCHPRFVASASQPRNRPTSTIIHYCVRLPSLVSDLFHIIYCNSNSTHNFHIITECSFRRAFPPPSELIDPYTCRAYC